MTRILGLDLGSYSIKAVELHPKLRGVEVGQLRELLLRGDDPPLSELLLDFLRTHRLPTEHVVCALPGDRVAIHSLFFPFADRRKIEQAVPFEVEGRIPLDVDEVLTDWIPVGGDRTRSEVAVAVAPRLEVAWLLDLLRPAGIEPRVVEVEGLALGNLAALFDLSGTRLLVDLGHRKTTLCLCVDGRPLTSRTVPIGGRAITEAIAKERHLELDEAEQHKREQGIFAAGAGSQAVVGAVAVVDRIARELARTLGSLEPRLGGRAAEHVDEITLLGGTARLHRLDAYLSERLGIVAAPLSLPDDPALVAGGDPRVFAPATALALRGTPRARTRTNLRRGELARRVDLEELRRRLRPTAWLAGAAVVLALAAAVTQITVHARRADAIEAQTASIYTDVFPSGAVPERPVQALHEAALDAEERADFLGVYRGNLSALDVLTEVAAHVPAELDVVVEEMRIESEAVRMRGFAPTVQALDRIEASLRGYEPFSQVRVGDIQDDAKRNGYSFQLSISLAPPGATP